ncbi:MAG: polysaccharide biosynthesis tyrosine autokinase [Alphaproteobacteria bacterium]|nr:polysaccharide biosynthesis tyrosine autokinase [Alphaproteobacteria bacterium]
MSNISSFPQRQDAPPAEANATQRRAPSAAKPVFETTESYDIWWLISVLRRRLKLIAVIMVIIPVATVLYVNTLAPTYSAELRLLIEGDRERVLNIASVAQGLSPDSSTIQTEAEFIASREIALQTVQQLGLQRDPEFNPTLRAVDNRPWIVRVHEILPEPLYGWLTPAIEWSLSTVSMLGGERLDQAGGGGVPQVRDEPALTTNTFMSKLTVDAARFARVITITFHSTDPTTAARVANAIANVYLRDNRERREQSLRRASAWLTGRVSGLRDSVNEAERQLEQFRRDFGLVEIGGASLLRQQIAQLNNTLISAEIERAEQEARYSQVLTLTKSPDGLESVDLVQASAVITQLRLQESQLRRRVAELETRYQDKYPPLVQARDQLADLRAMIRTEVTRIAQNLRNQVEIARVRERNMQTAVNRLQAQLDQQTDAEVTLRSLESEAEASRDLYELILTRLKETDVQDESLKAPEARIISRAVVPETPIAPRKKVAVLASVLGAAILGGVIVLIVEFSIRGFKTPQQIEVATGLPVLAQLPLNDELSNKMTLSRLLVERPGSTVTQALRRLRTTMSLVLQEEANRRVVLVSSSISGEGKSTVVEGLSALTARAGRRVLLIDADMQNPVQHKRLGVSNVVGLSDYLVGDAELDEVIEFNPDSGLYYISRGSSVQNPEDIIGSTAMVRLLDEARKRFDLVLVDTAPVSSVGDALILTPMVDGVLYIVEWERTHRETVIQNIRDIYEIGENVLGVVLTKVNLRVQAFDTGIEYYYYGYGSESAPTTQAR